MEDKKNGLGIFLLKNGNKLVGNFFDGEIEGLALIFPPTELMQLCYMVHSKPETVITNENQKRNIMLSTEYKSLSEFYKFKKEIVERYSQETQKFQ